MSREIYIEYTGDASYTRAKIRLSSGVLPRGSAIWVIPGMYSVRVRHFLKEHHTEGVGQYQHRRPASRDARAAALRPRRLRRVLLAGTVVVPVERLRALRYNR